MTAALSNRSVFAMALPPRNPRTLVVDDDIDLASMVVELLRRAGHEVTAVHDARSAMTSIELSPPNLLITDVCMEGIDGLELIEWTRRFDPRITAIAITAFGSIETAVRAVRLGAYDFVTKPFEPQTFRLAVERAVEHNALHDEVSRLRHELGARFGVAGIVGRSTHLAEIVDLVRRVADGTATVLVTGPSGTGKELVARALHTESKRRTRRFVAVNCAAIPDTLLESELFGYKRGAFTDARTDRVGLFQEADGGTLFLDEIGDLPMALQAKILRVLQEREVRPLGAAKAEPIDVRVVAATHQDLRRLVKEGRFREDLFYRLAVIEIGIAPLRDRTEDIAPLAEHFLQKFNERSGRAIKGFSGAALKRMEAYAWPGNVRELENAVERAVTLARDEWITPDDLPATLQNAAVPDFLTAAAEREMTLDELTMAYVHRVLERNGGNKKRTARLLGIDRRTIQRWLGESATESDEV
jgi:DNA-binding NtrC family response regulator